MSLTCTIICINLSYALILSDISDDILYKKYIKETRGILINMKDHWHCYLFHSCFMAYFSTVTNGRILQALVEKIIQLCSSLFTEWFVLPYDHDAALILAIVPLVNAICYPFSSIIVL